MTAQINEIQEKLLKQTICRDTIETLDQWFGIPEANELYIQKVADEKFIAIKMDDAYLGFISAKIHNPKSAEITIMGLKEEYHRHGYGKKLVQEMETFLKLEGVEYLTVKTLADTRDCEEYEKTRQFYNSVGFVELEIITEIWGDENPCSFMAKKLI